MGRVSQLQLYMLFTQYIYTTMLGFYVNMLAGSARYSAWLALILGTVGGLAIVYVSFRVAKREPEQFFAFFGKEIVGRWLHVPLMALMMFSIFLAAAFILREFQEYLVQIYLPETPGWAVGILFGCCIAYAVRSGLESIFRCAQGIFFLGIVGVALLPLFVNSEINFDSAIAFVTQFEPIGIWRSAYFISSLVGEMSLVLFIFPCFKNSGRTMRTLIWAAITGNFVIQINVLASLMLFGPELSSNLAYPTLELIRYIRAGGFLENLDPFLIAMWMTSLFIKISLLLYIVVFGMTQMLSLKDHKPLTLAMSALLVGLSLFMVRSLTELNAFLDKGEVTFLLCTELVPAIYLVVGWLRGLVGQGRRTGNSTGS